MLSFGDTYTVQVHVDSFLDEAPEWQTIAMNLSKEAAIERVQAVLLEMAAGLDAA